MELHFGAMADRIGKQLDAQNLCGTKDQRSAWQADADAITRLAVRGLLSDSQKTRIRAKLMRKITKLLRGEHG